METGNSDLDGGSAATSGAIVCENQGIDGDSQLEAGRSEFETPSEAVQVTAPDPSTQAWNSEVF
jgi:hypothetical protein